MKKLRFYVFQALCLGGVLHVNAILGVYISPYLYQPIEDYNLTNDRSKIGYYAGFIGGALFLGRAVSSNWWDKFADTKGRIPTLILNFALLGVTNLFFIFATNFYLGLTLRFLSGVVGAGLMAAGRVLMTEIAPSQLKSWAVGICSALWQFDGSVGLFLGGHLINIVPGINYLVIGLVTAALYIITIIVVKMNLKETLGANQQESYELKAIGQQGKPNLEEPLTDFPSKRDNLLRRLSKQQLQEAEQIVKTSRVHSN